MNPKVNVIVPLINEEELSRKSASMPAVSRRLFFRAAGLGTIGLGLSRVGLSRNIGLEEFDRVTLFSGSQKHYYAHDAILDRYGVIAPWYQQQNGQCDYRVRIAAETLKRYPWTTTENAVAAYPDYLFTSKWHISPEGDISPTNPGDWMNGDLGQRSTSALKGWVEYYRYSGDPAAIAHLTFMGDFVLDYCLTPEDHPWPKFPISVPSKGKAYGNADPSGMIQLDICGSMAHGLLRAYQVTGNKRWFDAVKHWGDLFAEKCNLNADAAPWPRYANPENSFVDQQNKKYKDDPRINLQTGGVTMILGFLDELIRLGYTGKNKNIVLARDAGVKYLRDTLLPKWIKNDTWGLYFWDWLNYSQNCSTTADVSSYIIKNKALFPNWRNDARNILSVFLNRSSANPDSRGDVYSGAWAYPESSSCCQRSLWYAPLMDGSVLAQYGMESGNSWAKELAKRQLILQTYDVHENGVTEDNIDGGVIVNGNWLNIAHPVPLLCILNAISWMPEELGASRENHLVRSTAVVNSIIYGKGNISYSTFDAPVNTIAIFRLSFIPEKITAGSNTLHIREDLKSNGYTVNKLPNNDCIVKIRHDAAKKIIISGPDPQSVIENTAFIYEGAWQKKKLSSSAILYCAETEGAAVTVKFHGNQLRIISNADPYGGYADVFIDGQKQIVPIDFWNPAERSGQTLYYKNGLHNGPHTLKIIARGTGNHYSKGKRIYIDSAQFSDESNSYNFLPGTGPAETQRMIFGYTKRQDYKDSNGNLWRPGTEVITRVGRLKDTVERCWWMDPVNTISGTSDAELYRYGYHAKEFWVNITVAPGKYDVRLKFAATRGVNADKNSFDILINGQKKVSGLDVLTTAGGPNKAVDLLFNDIIPVSGIIEIRFTASDSKDGEAFLQALEVGRNLSGKGATPVSVQKGY